MATVTIEGTSYGAMSDVHGRFIIRNVEPGTHHVLGSYIGYRTIFLADKFASQSGNTTGMLELQPSKRDETADENAGDFEDQSRLGRVVFARTNVRSVERRTHGVPWDETFNPRNYNALGCPACTETASREEDWLA